MALTKGQIAWIQKLSNMSAQQIANKALTDQANVLFNSAGGWSDATLGIKQADLDGSQFAGLKLSDLQSAVGALTGAVSAGIGNNLSFLAELAAAGGN